MCQSENVPENQILVLDIILSCSHVVYTTSLKLTLERKSTCSVQLIVLVLGHPHMVVCEKSSLRLNASLASEYLLRGQRCELVSNGVTRLWVRLRRVDDLEDAVIEGVRVDARRLIDGCLADLVEVAVGVGFFVPGRRVGFFVEDCVFVAVDCWVETRCEDVLVVLGKYTT